MAGQTAFSRQVNVFVGQLTGEPRRKLLIDAANAARDQALAQDAQILGFPPPIQTIVDGRQNAQVESVKIGGTIVFLFDVASLSLQNAVDELMTLLAQLSPVLTGRFQKSFRLLVNNVERDATTEGAEVKLQPIDEVTVTNLQPYARRIERGSSSQAPNGVFESAAATLRTRFGKVIDIRFAYQEFPGFAVGSTRAGGKPRTRGEVKRAASYPTIILRVK